MRGKYNPSQMSPRLPNYKIGCFGTNANDHSKTTYFFVWFTFYCDFAQTQDIVLRRNMNG